MVFLLTGNFYQPGFFSPGILAADPNVTIKEDAETFTMDNGIIQVRISKVTGDLVSFRYKNMELFETTLTPDIIPNLRERSRRITPTGAIL